MKDHYLSIQLDGNAGVMEIREHDVVTLTPKIARRLIERHAGQVSGEVTLVSVNPFSGDRWVTIYRVTPKSCRRIYNDIG